MTDTDLARSNFLADLAARIRTEHEAVFGLLRHGLQRAFCAGEFAEARAGKS